MNEEEKKAIELLEEFIKYYEAEATSRKFRGTLSIRVDEDDIDALENLINMYKRALKENEELKQDKINNYRMIALAQNEALGYMQGYEDGKKLKTSAIASIVENQQYYIIKKQMEKYEEHIAKLQKENEELTISNKEIDKECSRLEKKEVELINENEHYEDLIYALKTYYDITEEDLEKCMKNDR